MDESLAGYFSAAPGPPLTVAEVVDRLATSPSDEGITDALDRGAQALVGHDLIHRLVPFAARLRDVNYDDHPWGALSAGVAICAVDRVRGRAVLVTAREAFANAGNPDGEGWACFLEGLEDLGEGNISSAETWWNRSRALLGPTAPASQLSASHLSLAAYRVGDLAQAARIAENALGDARIRKDDRLIAISGVYLALFRWWMGDFDAVVRAAQSGQDALARISDPLDRYEEPLMHAAFGTVSTMRGDVETGARHLEAGIAKSVELHNEWYEAIVRTIRAVVMSEHDPLRGIDDARRALDYYESVGEEWWSLWALEAYVIAQREYGDLHASATAGRKLMQRVDNHLERGRARLELATTLILLGDTDEPRDLLTQSIAELEHAGARYLTARAELQLARISHNRSAYLLRSARARAGANADDPAWKRLLRGASIRIDILGAARVQVEGRVLSFPTRHELEALAALALAGTDGVSTERLCEMLWPSCGPDASRHRLDVLVSSLRQNLMPATRLTRANGVLQLDIDEDECDVVRAVATCRRFLADRSLPVEDACVALESRLLGGANEDWVIDEQQQLDELRTRVETLIPAARPVASA